MRFCRNLIWIPPRWLASLFNLLCPVALWLQLTQGFNSFQLHWFCTDNPDNVPDCLKLLFFWYSTVLKAFGAIASSSVAFQWQLEQFKITKGPKLRKWKWPLSPKSESGQTCLRRASVSSPFGTVLSSWEPQSPTTRQSLSPKAQKLASLFF